MKTMILPALAAGLALGAAPAIAAPAPTPAPAAAAVPGIAGIGVADLNAAVSNANAIKVAAQQRQVTYKPQIDQANARAAQLQAQLKPMVDKFERDRAAPTANTPAGQAALQSQANTIQTLQQNGQNEIAQIIKPAVYSEAYVTEQVEDKLNQAVTNAMTKNRVAILLSPQAVLARSNANDLTGAVLAELDALIPNANPTPPAGWEPRQIREARAQQAAQQQGAAPAATAPAARPPAGPAPDGR